MFIPGMFPLSKLFDLTIIVELELRFIPGMFPSSTVIVRSNRLFKGNIPGINLSSSATVIVRSNRLLKGNIPGINLSSSSTIRAEIYSWNVSFK
jgi:hypothetical protein